MACVFGHVGRVGDVGPVGALGLLAGFRRVSAGLAALGRAALVVAGLGIAASGCAGSPPGVDATPAAIARQADRDALAALAAAAKDRHYIATYTLSAAGRPDRTVTVAIATDGSWIVGVPGGALGGLADVAVFSSAAGLFQCSLGPAAGSATARPDVPPQVAGCAAVARMTATIDPRVQHVFTDWIDPLVDKATALSVAATSRLPGAQGTCYSVESNSAALAPPVDPGVYCYASDGVLTAARVGFGMLVLAGPVAPGPPSVAIPAPVVGRAALPMAAPPPQPTPSPSAATSPNHQG